jgi:hypothetical protein
MVLHLLLILLLRDRWGSQPEAVTKLPEQSPLISTFCLKHPRRRYSQEGFSNGRH